MPSRWDSTRACTMLKKERETVSGLPQHCLSLHATVRPFCSLLRCWARIFSPALLGRMAWHLLELFHDLVQVVARRILHRREPLVGLELLEPHRLADGQEVPVVYVTRDWPAQRAAEPETRLFLVAPPHLEWIALEVDHAGDELGLDSREHEARRVFGRDREIHLPILVAHRGRMGAGIVEEVVARG